MLFLTVIGIGAAVLAAPKDAGIGAGLQFYRNGQYEQALAELNERLQQKLPEPVAAQALYAVASIHFSQKKTAEAEAVLLQLVNSYPRSPWALNAYDQLADRAEKSGNWVAAGQRIGQFLDLYVQGEFATLDDLICQRMFNRLVEYTGRSSGVKDLNEVYGELRNKYPPGTHAGRVVEFHARPDPKDPEANLVLNPGFELDARACGTPIGWSYKGTEPNVQDDADGVMQTGRPVEMIKARSGTFCAGKYTGWGKHRGWFFQRVAVMGGRKYEVTAFGMTPASKGQPGQLRLGLDLGGGTDPEAEQVRWTALLSATAGYEKLGFEGSSAVMAQGDRITVFLELRQENPVDPNAMLFDDVAVRQAK